jgi:GntR family transcriptional regulator
MLWNSHTPIFQQLREKIENMLIEQQIPPDRPIPSVRYFADYFEISPLTVARTFKELAASGLIEKRRGVGMFVVPGAVQKLVLQQRKTMIADEIPALLRKAHRLGITLPELLKLT